MSEIHLPHDHHQNIENHIDSIPSLQDFQTVSTLFKQLDEPSRIRLFWILCHCEECVINLASIMDMSSPALSHHLKYLKMSGLITSRREGKEVYYTAAKTLEVQLLHQTIESLIDLTCPSL